MEINDSLDDLFGGPMTSNGQARQAPPASYTPNKAFVEGCRHCRGTGWWRPGYRCFTCKGAGSLTYKTSPEERAKNRQAAATKKANDAIALLSKIDAWMESHAEVYAWMMGNKDSFEFAASLHSALLRYGELTDGQLAAANKCIARSKQYQEARAIAAQQRIDAAPVVDTAGIDRLKAAFDRAVAYSAEKGLKLSPRITVNGMTISPAKATSANPGALYVKTREAYLGKIMNGKFFASRDCSAEQTVNIQQFVADPAEAAKVYGQTTGTCCICNATLRSEWKNRGIGPICAEKFGW